MRLLFICLLGFLLVPSGALSQGLLEDLVIKKTIKTLKKLADEDENLPPEKKGPPKKSSKTYGTHDEEVEAESDFRQEQNKWRRERNETVAKRESEARPKSKESYYNLGSKKSVPGNFSLAFTDEDGNRVEAKSRDIDVSNIRITRQLDVSGFLDAKTDRGPVRIQFDNYHPQGRGKASFIVKGKKFDYYPERSHLPSPEKAVAKILFGKNVSGGMTFRSPSGRTEAEFKAEVPTPYIKKQMNGKDPLPVMLPIFDFFGFDYKQVPGMKNALKKREYARPQMRRSKNSSRSNIQNRNVSASQTTGRQVVTQGRRSHSKGQVTTTRRVFPKRTSTTVNRSSSVRRPSNASRRTQPTSQSDFYGKTRRAPQSRTR